jgi:hypothetical protein
VYPLDRCPLPLYPLYISCLYLHPLYQAPNNPPSLHPSSLPPCPRPRCKHGDGKRRAEYLVGALDGRQQQRDQQDSDSDHGKQTLQKHATRGEVEGASLRWGPGSEGDGGVVDGERETVMVTSMNERAIEGRQEREFQQGRMDKARQRANPDAAAAERVGDSGLGHSALQDAALGPLHCRRGQTRCLLPGLPHLPPHTRLHCQSCCCPSSRHSREFNCPGRGHLLSSFCWPLSQSRSWG